METAPDTEPAKKPTAPAAAPSPATTKTQRLERIPLTLIDQGNNYRKTYDAKELAELAVSVRAVNVRSPVTLRPSGKRFELVVGERRRRACLLSPAEIKKALPGQDVEQLGPAPTEILAVIEDLTDAQVREIQLVENSQRAGVHPLEEAEAYREMIEKDGHTQETIAAKIGKSPATVRAKLELLKLAPGPKKALASGALSFSVAERIARIPRKDWQEKATLEVLGKADHQIAGVGEILLEEIETVDEDGKTVRESTPMSARAASAHIERNYMLRLSIAHFPTADAMLDKAAGACGPCPKRTGAQRELFADISNPDLCTDPTCFEKKTALHWDRTAAAAMREGRRILDEKEMRGVFESYDDTKVAAGSKYVELATALPYELEQRTGKKTYGALLGKDGAKALPMVVARDGKGAARELVEKTAVLEAARKAGAIKPEPKGKAASSSGGSSGDKSRDEFREMQKKQQARDALKRKVDQAVLGEIAAKASVEPKNDLANNALWGFIAAAVTGPMNEATLQPVIHRRQLGKASSVNQQSKKTLRTFIAGADADECRGLVVELLAAQPAWAGEKNWQAAAAEVLGVDVKKVEGLVKAEQKILEKAAEKEKADKAKAKKPAAAKAKKK